MVIGQYGDESVPLNGNCSTASKILFESAYDYGYIVVTLGPGDGVKTT